MADEYDVRISLEVRKPPLRYQSYPTQFFADMEGDGEPVPGIVQVNDQEGTHIDLSVNSRTIGIALFENHGPGEYVEYGIYDPELLIYYPLGEILPGERFVLRLSRNVQTQYGPTGTGTTGHAVENRLWMLSHGGDSLVLFDCFEN